MIQVSEADNELVITGEVKQDDIYSGICCPGFDWEVVVVISDIWGVCFNPDCDLAENEPPYGRVSSICLDDLAVKLADGGDCCHHRDRRQRDGAACRAGVVTEGEG